MIFGRHTTGIEIVRSIYVCIALMGNRAAAAAVILIEIGYSKTL